MPITRRRRANPPEQPENNNNDHLAAQPAENTAEDSNGEQLTEAPALGETEVNSEQRAAAMPAFPPISSFQGEDEQNSDDQQNSNNHQPSLPTALPSQVNGERIMRQEYLPGVESGRRTVFRRPMQQSPVPQAPLPPPPTTPPFSPLPSPALQSPTHEIKLPLGTKPGDTTGDPLHLAYNPGYTGADEVRSILLRKMATESKHGGRARCWNCGSLAISYECWNTRNKAFGEIGIAFCEICGVWSVL